ncbi:MAG: hypothetical protein ACP5N2_05330 [Candidatus Nanoarchaeia archaeon]
MDKNFDDYRPVRIYSASLIEKARPSLESAITTHISEGKLQPEQLRTILSIYDSITKVSKSYHEGRDNHGKKTTLAVNDIFRQQNNQELIDYQIQNLEKIISNLGQNPTKEQIAQLLKESNNLYIKYVQDSEAIDPIIESSIINAINKFGHSPELILIYGVKIKPEEIPLLDSTIPEEERNQLRRDLKLGPESHAYYFDGGIPWTKSLYNEPGSDRFNPPQYPMKFFDPKLKEIINRWLYLDKATLVDSEGHVLANKVEMNINKKDPRLTNFKLSLLLNEYYSKTKRTLKYGNMRQSDTHKLSILIPEIYAFTKSEETGHVRAMNDGKVFLDTSDPYDQRGT